ncbi:hypothetical protein SAMN05421504_11082 [Amycolatopsis xylanica]|uniref:Nitroreductase family protein n=1 Tax=Amycolatopsis xylanica TaxID=589385 RepID=A0A1H3QTF1_9PSEU|nr:nitroreductase [Amycolatopsis xylanica]SDZ16794.1 hypothetical protein SAMN05421504_11082 [Amycolatopsis xylanica]
MTTRFVLGRSIRVERQPTTEDLATDGQVRIALHVANRVQGTHVIRPWCFEVEDDRIEVWLESDRAWPGTMPPSREVRVNCGAAIFNLRTGLRASGRSSATHLLPNRRRPGHLATVWLKGARPPAFADQALYRAIAHWRPHPHPFDRRPVAPNIVNALARAARAEGLDLIQSHDSTMDGRDARAPLVAEIVSRGDTALDQLHAGQAMQRVLLAATASGVSASYTIPEEAIKKNRTTRGRRDGDTYSQVVIRFGYGFAAVTKTTF